MTVDGSADNVRYLVEYTVNAYGTYKLGAAVYYTVIDRATDLIPV